MQVPPIDVKKDDRFALRDGRVVVAAADAVRGRDNYVLIPIYDRSPAACFGGNRIHLVNALYPSDALIDVAF